MKRTPQQNRRLRELVLVMTFDQDRRKFGVYRRTFYPSCLLGPVWAKWPELAGRNFYERRVAGFFGITARECEYLFAQYDPGGHIRCGNTHEVAAQRALDVLYANVTSHWCYGTREERAWRAVS